MYLFIDVTKDTYKGANFNINLPVSDKSVYDVPGVNIYDENGVELGTVILGQLGTNLQTKTYFKLPFHPSASSYYNIYK